MANPQNQLQRALQKKKIYDVTVHSSVTNEIDAPALFFAWPDKTSQAHGTFEQLLAAVEDADSVDSESLREACKKRGL